MADAIAEELPEEILDDKPTILELTNHVTDGVNPHLMGVSLGLADDQQQRFDGIIRRTNIDEVQRLSEIYNLWLNTCLHPTRRAIIDILENSKIGNYSLCQKYKQQLRLIHKRDISKSIHFTFII